ncbi:MAG: HAD family phosphatase [Gammaproteobacteria bacterium]|jgi:HAD superfamily hydrolase (TIGR01509 family)
MALVIFDCDGVLVDSEPLANAVLNQHLCDAGLEISLEESTRLFTGLSMTSCIALIEARLGRPVGDRFVSDLRAATDAAFRRALKPVSGVSAVLGRLGQPFCVASSGIHTKIRRSLDLTGLRGFFPESRIFSAEDVDRGKPAPDLFLHCAERLGSAPGDCVVVEDSRPGVLAARAAGMRVLGYAERTPPRVLAAAGATVFTRMAELDSLLPG